MHTAVTDSETATIRLGRSLAAILQPGDVLAIDGELGTGKTRLVEGLARELGYEGGVTSPTFTLVHEYECEPPLAHVDAYRLADGDEFLSLGISEMWEAGVVAVEWAERVRDVLPRRRLNIRGETMTADSRRWLIEWNCDDDREASLEVAVRSFTDATSGRA